MLLLLMTRTELSGLRLKTAAGTICIPFTAVDDYPASFSLACVYE